MGAAKSSNVSDAVTNVSNFVQNSTSANANQRSDIVNTTNINNCEIVLSGDFDVKTYTDVVQQSTQISTAKNDTNLSNNIQQQMLQEATSKVGSLGIGYADASNSASELVNSTNSIINSINESANQATSINNSFSCNDSYIKANNMIVDFSSSSNFLSDQVLNQQDTSSIVNDISQSITQKATATVEGLGALLIALAIIIGVIIWSVGSTVSKVGNTTPVKMIVGLFLIVLVISLFVWCYVDKKPPFFNDPDQCIPSSTIGCSSDCINQTMQTMKLENPPLKYIYGLSGTSPNLVQMAISAVAVGNSTSAGANGGYRVDTMNTLQARIDSIYNEPQFSVLVGGIPKIPNPLCLPLPSPPSNQYYKIPQEYLNSGGSTANPSDTSGLCSPGIAQVSPVSTSSQITIDCKTSDISYSYWNQQSMYTTSPLDAVANTNISEWNEYLNPSLSEIYPQQNAQDTSLFRSLIARFVLSKIIGSIELNVYVNDYDIVQYTKTDGTVVIGYGKDNKNICHFYVPTSYDDETWQQPVSGSGSLTGLAGVCDTNEYKFQNFMKKIGIWFILLLFVGTVGMLGYSFFKKRKNNSTELETKK